LSIVYGDTVNPLISWSMFLACAVSTTSLLAQEGDLTRFHGLWEVTELVEDGKVIPRQAIPDWLPSGGRLEIADHAIMIHSTADNKKHVRLFSIDATQYPRAITLTGSDKEQIHGIYRFDENRLIVCLADPADKAPTEFSAKEGTRRMLLVMQPVATAKTTAKPAPEKEPKPEEAPVATVLTDADVTKLAEGVWKYDDTQGSLFVLLRGNGTFSTTREFQEMRLFQKVFVQTPVTAGTWKVEGGTMKFHVTSSIYASRVGNTFGFAVRSISNKDFIFVDYLGRVGRAKKIQ
jgi:uncharacterized protein (TIGR03067 family)